MHCWRQIQTCASIFNHISKFDVFKRNNQLKKSVNHFVPLWFTFYAAPQVFLLLFWRNHICTFFSFFHQQQVFQQLTQKQQIYFGTRSTHGWSSHSGNPRAGSLFWQNKLFALLLHPSLHMHASTLHKQADTLPPNRPKIGVRLLF